MTEDQRNAAVKTATTGIRNPFGCTFALLDIAGIVAVISHFGQIVDKLAGLIRLIP